MIFKGRAWKFGDNVDTDVIMPARYLNTTNPQELASHCMEDIDKDFSNKVSKGDIIVAGRNFGCGSSREHAPVAIKACGISCIIATNFARIFFRNAINIGLPILESKEASCDIKGGDIIEVDLNKGAIRNITSGKVFHSQPFPEFMQKLIKAGGLMEWVKKRVKTKESEEVT